MMKEISAEHSHRQTDYVADVIKDHAAPGFAARTAGPLGRHAGGGGQPVQD